MAAEKQAFQLKANFNTFSFWVGEKEVRIEAGDTYETSDPDEINVLTGAGEGHPQIKAADTPAKSSSAKAGK